MSAGVAVGGCIVRCYDIRSTLPLWHPIPYCMSPTLTFLTCILCSFGAQLTDFRPLYQSNVQQQLQYSGTFQFLRSPSWRQTSAQIAVMVLDKTVGFIGAGQMAEALARGFIDKGVITAANVHATDIAKARRELFQNLGAHAYEKNAEVSAKAKVLSNGVLKQNMNLVL